DSTRTGAQNYPAPMVIINDGAVTPMFNVSWTGQGVMLPPCNYTITPSSVTWGVVPQGMGQTMSVRIDNVGTDTCLLGDFEIVPQGGDFHLVNGNETGIMLPAGMGKDVPIQFLPMIQGPQSAAFE